MSYEVIVLSSITERTRVMRSATQMYRMVTPRKSSPMTSTVPVHPVSVFEGEKKIISGNESGTSAVPARSTLYIGLVNTLQSLVVTS